MPFDSNIIPGSCPHQRRSSQRGRGRPGTRKGTGCRGFDPSYRYCRFYITTLQRGKPASQGPLAVQAMATGACSRRTARPQRILPYVAIQVKPRFSVEVLNIN